MKRISLVVQIAALLAFPASAIMVQEMCPPTKVLEMTVIRENRS
jgi:hypothetical protein